MEEEESLLEFPCAFPIKAMGLAEPGFDELIIELVRRHAPDIRADSVSARPSKGGKWISITVTIQARNKAQLDAIYQDLTDHEKVVMAL